jgi:hypothetical protein
MRGGSIMKDGEKRHQSAEKTRRKQRARKALGGGMAWRNQKKENSGNLNGSGGENAGGDICKQLARAAPAPRKCARVAARWRLRHRALSRRTPCARWRGAATAVKRNACMRCASSNGIAALHA